MTKPYCRENHVWQYALEEERLMNEVSVYSQCGWEGRQREVHVHGTREREPCQQKHRLKRGSSSCLNREHWSNKCNFVLGTNETD